MTKLLKSYPAAVSALSLLAPLTAFAQATLDTILQNVSTTLGTVIGVLFVLATVVFLWGVIQFIANADNEEKRAKSKGIMTWGIIGLAVMAAAWGIVAILTAYFQIGTTPPTFVEPPKSQSPKLPPTL